MLTHSPGVYVSVVSSLLFTRTIRCKTVFTEQRNKRPGRKGGIIESTDDLDLGDKDEADDGHCSGDDFDDDEHRGELSLGAVCLCQMTSNHSAPPLASIRVVAYTIIFISITICGG